MSRTTRTTRKICVSCKGTGRYVFLAGDTGCCQSCGGSGWISVTVLERPWS